MKNRIIRTYIEKRYARLVRRAIRAGSAQAEGVVVVDGLQGTEQVITVAGAFLHEGEKVRVDVPKATP